ncbi:7353_t:CDS:2, partial [Acaulospora colombiana]
SECPDYDLCERCYKKGLHPRSHHMLPIVEPEESTFLKPMALEDSATTVLGLRVYTHKSVSSFLEAQLRHGSLRTKPLFPSAQVLALFLESTKPTWLVFTGPSIMHLLPLFTLSTLFVFVYAKQIPLEGDGEIQGYPGTRYTAHNYRPICGLMATEQFNQTFYIKEDCEAAIHQFRGTDDTFALYDRSGVRKSDTFPIARDDDVCMCYALADLDGRKASWCILVLKDGTTSDYMDNSLFVWAGYPFAIGSFQLATKALPHCFDIDTAEVISSLDAAGDATHLQVEPATSTTVDSGGGDPSQTDTLGGSNPSSTLTVSTRSSTFVISYLPSLATIDGQQ